MRCQECRHEWTPPPDTCPQCGADMRGMLPPPRLIDTRPLNDKAFFALMTVFATFIGIQFSPYAVILPIISLVLAVLGLVEIGQSKGRMSGTGLAVIALLVSGYFVFVGVLGLVTLFR